MTSRGRSRRTWLVVLPLAALTACGGSSTAPGATAPGAAGPADTEAPVTAAGRARAVEHAKGRTEVPARPTRVVMLHSPTNMMALGTNPVGAWRLARDKAHHPELRDQFEEMVDLGNDPVDLETIISLEPDLIVGRSPNHDDIYGRLSRMAPTVLTDASGIDPGGDWKAQFLFTAEVLGKQEEGQRLLAAYEARIDEFQSRMGERLAAVDVSVVRPGDGLIQLHTRGGFSGAVLEEAGVGRPPSQDLDAAQTRALNQGGDAIRYDIAKERLRDADGDVIILWTSSSTVADGQATNDARTADLRADPVWAQLGAVQRGDVHEVGGHWVGFGILEANLILDDLSAALFGDGR